MRQCRNCFNTFDDRMRFCPYCRESVEEEMVQCPNCGNLTPKKGTYCGYCSNRLICINSQVDTTSFEGFILKRIGRDVVVVEYDGNKDFYYEMAMDNGDRITVEIPEGVTIIQDNAFNKKNGWYHCIDRIVIPNSVKYIGNFAFYGCKKLSFIIIPASVQQIGVEFVYNKAFPLLSANEVIISCSPGSYAEYYAKKNGIKCDFNYF